MGDWKLVHEKTGKLGTTKVYQDREGNVRIDSFNGDVTDRVNHDRFTLNTWDGGHISGHGYNHTDKFDTPKDKTK